ncbi:MAG: bifunctional demethylmenaquinone methyltransferase/2-methoxy-6-polyprenyl-1,4-benzoquinol methylase UbiE [Wenzhouxiangellaceae bacterium]|nr:bifunctional demethylmenaquinone methyltransferase/2-methoxy-6-polyprenyl-1,4-benzoquinol methylase UbiE [Wenzhouxiangellaceae bacterium]
MSKAIHQMFSRIAERYDRANRWMSFGSDQGVRRRAVKMSGAGPGDDVLDCAAGTGDLTLMLHQAVEGRGRVVGTDFNADMLKLAAAKSADVGADIEWREEDAQQLSFPDASFDVVSIAYGIRNVDDPEQALRSMYRVLKPGGRLVVLEFGQPPKLIRPFYLAFNRIIIPFIGGLAGGDRDAYQYLQRSSDQFPYGDRFIEMIRASGNYCEILAKPVIAGINYIYIATRNSR